MNKKHTLKKTAALFLGIALTVGGAGCNFIVTDGQKDLEQVVATVNISESLKNTNDDYSAFAADVNTLIEKGGLATDISKRDLIAYFMSAGYTYVQSYGYTYEDTFNMLMDSLVDRKLMTQYAVAYYLKKGLSAEDCINYVNAETEKAEGVEKDLLKAHPEVLTMKYFLTNGGKTAKEDMDDYNLAVYSLMKSLNSSLDSMESSYIVAEEEEHDHGEARTTPTGVGTELEDYYPVDEQGNIDYAVYTGRNPLDLCGAYEKVEGSTTASRKKAYNAFLVNLQSYNLIGKSEDTADITKIDYYYAELASSLGQALINKYFDDLQEEAIKSLTGEYVTAKYNEILEAQTASYASVSAFENAIGSVSDDSFVLYGAKDFGFVYNILIPFSTSQSQEYSAVKKKGLTQDEIYAARKTILENVQAKDLRDSWFSEHDHANYAYEAEEGNYYQNGLNKGDKVYLFFEDSVKNTNQYEALTQYAGQYPYNGVVTKDGHDYDFAPNKMGIDAFIDEMEGYIASVSGRTVKGEELDAYNASTYYVETEENGETVVDYNRVDYSKFAYYAGKVDLADTSSANFFNKESDQYKALSAVNELMFAYSTDTGCLNTYMGYTVSPYTTSYVKEFEYAAQLAIMGDETLGIDGGVGTYVVCATDYGWHIIYCSFAYGENGGEVYGGYNHAQAVGETKVEGSFSNMFYESLKTTTATTLTNEIQNNVLNKHNNDDSVTLFKARYKDLLTMDE